MIYHDLLIKAAELGAHAVINVNIEDVQRCTSERSTTSQKSFCNTVRYGAGLAIKYTDSIILDWNEGKNTQKTVVTPSANNEIQIKYPNNI